MLLKKFMFNIYVDYCNGKYSFKAINNFRTVTNV